MQEERKISPLWIIPAALILGVGAGLGLLNALARAARVGFSLSIVNPPPAGNYWQLVLYDEVGGDSVIAGTNIPVDQPITLEALPAGWAFPVFFDLEVYENPEPPHNVVYKPPSVYGIPGYGDYQFDCATGTLFKV